MSLFEELKRRNVVKVGVLYIVAAWLTLQVAELLFDALELPSTWLRLVLAILILGFPLAVLFSWVFELTPEGIKREKDVDRSVSVTADTGRKINVLIVVLLVLAIGTVVVDRLVPERETPVAVEATPSPDASSQQAAAATQPEREAPAGPPERSVAVLPFVNMSDDPENEYFADGLSEEILNFLAGVPDLQVTARTSSFQFKGKNEDVREIGDSLNVAHILEGSVRRAGDRARITAQLIRTSDGYHLWSETYDRKMDDVFEIQTEIAESVTRALGVVLDERQRQSMIDAGVRNVDAFVAYQRGYEKFFEAHNEDIDLSILKQAADQFTRAIELEPGFAEAYFMRSDYYAHLITTPGVDEAVRADAFDAYGRDLAAASEHARSPAQRALVEVDRGLIATDWSTLPARLEEAFSYDTCQGGVWIEVAPLFGFADELESFSRRRTACDPLNFYNPYDAGRAAFWAGRPEEALQLATEGLKNAPRQAWLEGMSVTALLVQGHTGEAAQKAEGITVASSRNNAMLLVALAQGNLEEARTLAGKSLEASTPWQRMYQSINLNALVGDREAANKAAAWLDGTPAGPMMLASATVECMCGAPFDLEATPVFARRIAEAGVAWPPPTILPFTRSGN